VFSGHILYNTKYFITIFDLLFLLVLAGSAAVLAVSLVQMFRGDGDRAKRLLRGYAIFAVSYLGTAVVVWKLSPVRVLSLGDNQCSDDWCIAVDQAERISDFYDVTLRLSSRALRVQQRENGLTTYLTDDYGTRYNSEPDPSESPLSVLLDPGQSVLAKRRFRTRAGARNVALVVAHEGWFPVGWVIIGGDPFDKKTVVRLP
jgi:hypothetical protein